MTDETDARRAIPHAPAPPPREPGEPLAATRAAHSPSRRAVLRAAGSAGTIALGGVSLAACGGGGEGPKPTPVSGIPAAEIPLHGGKVFADAHVVVTHPAQGTFKAFDAICPHQGCLVSQIVKDTIRCPCHGSTFDADTGERLSGPAPKGLTPLTLSESGSTLDVS